MNRQDLENEVTFAVIALLATTFTVAVFFNEMLPWWGRTTLGSILLGINLVFVGVHYRRLFP